MLLQITLIKDYYGYDGLIAIAKEMTDLLLKNCTINWRKQENIKADMCRVVRENFFVSFYTGM